MTRAASIRFDRYRSPRPRPATSRLRGELLVAQDAEQLVGLFADALAEHGITGHFCLLVDDGRPVPLLGDRPDLIGRDEAMKIDCGSPFCQTTRMLLGPPSHPLGPEELARVRGYAELYAARALALHELADDVATACGLTLRERFVLGRRLTGLAPIDIADESGLSVATISATIDTAVERLGSDDAPAAIALAARRGWLAVTSLQNCASSSRKLTYKVTKNG